MSEPAVRSGVPPLELGTKEKPADLTSLVPTVSRTNSSGNVQTTSVVPRFLIWYNVNQFRLKVLTLFRSTRSRPKHGAIFDARDTEITKALKVTVWWLRLAGNRLSRLAVDQHHFPTGSQIARDVELSAQILLETERLKDKSGASVRLAIEKGLTDAWVNLDSALTALDGVFDAVQLDLQEADASVTRKREREEEEEDVKQPARSAKRNRSSAKPKLPPSPQGGEIEEEPPLPTPPPHDPLLALLNFEDVAATMPRRTDVPIDPIPGSHETPIDLSSSSSEAPPLPRRNRPVVVPRLQPGNRPVPHRRLNGARIRVTSEPHLLDRSVSQGSS